MISVVMPFFNRYDLLHQRLNDLFCFLPQSAEIVVVNDASTETDSKRILKWWSDEVFPNYNRVLRYVKNPENLGFGRSMNTGVAHARGEIIVLLSTDVIIRGNFTNQIEQLIRLDPKILIGGRVIYFDTGWNTFNFDGKPTTIPYCEGWLLACTKDAWKDIGGFDDRYAPYDYEDIDISLTATTKGYKLVGLNNSQLEHLSGQTIMTVNPDRMVVTERNRIRFYDKWKEEVSHIFETLEIANAERIND